VLLSFVEQLMSSGQLAPRSGPAIEGNEEDGETVRVKRIIRRMRIQVSFAMPGIHLGKVNTNNVRSYCR